jgi:hypothetical protein
MRFGASSVHSFNLSTLAHDYLSMGQGLSEFKLPPRIFSIVTLSKRSVFQLAV